MNVNFLFVEHGVVAIMHSDMFLRVLKAEHREGDWLLSTDRDNLLILVEFPNLALVKSACKYFALNDVDESQLRHFVDMCEEVEYADSFDDDSDLPW